ncbi:MULTISPECIES: hypothetical protein [unclassified Lysinibacillus]|uniref:hypothetical protein n=1 Tax=Lysinibacillus TaxID=400634 RepID=UPI00380D5BC7
MNEKGEELLAELVEIHKKMNTLIDTQVSSESGFHQTILNIKNTFFRGIAPSATNKSINFFNVVNDDIEKFREKANENKLGLYVFSLRLKEEESIEGFKSDWQSFKQENPRLSMPAVRGNDSGSHHYKKINRKDEIRHILYIGKSENLSERLKSHIEYGSDSTYCLRLKKFNEYVQKKKKRNKYEIDVCYIYSNEKNVSYILYPLERLLRKQFVPLLGSAR